MQTEGVVHNGAIVIEGGVPFPEGTRVVVSALAPAAASGGKGRITFPLVRSAKPGAIALTNERIAELLEDEDVSPRR